MKKPVITIFILLAFTMLLTQCEKDNETDPNATVDIPDKAFLNALLAQGIDTNGDSLISHMEAEAVNRVDVCGIAEIKSLEGLAAFKYIDTLHCCGTKITDLDVSGNRELIALICWGADAQLASLKTSHNKRLRKISVPGNKITSLELSNNPALEILFVHGNRLKQLDVSANSNLYELFCGINQLSSLDLSNNKELRWLDCSENPLTELDISNNKNLGKSGPGKNWDPAIGLYDMPALGRVCVWTMPFPPEGVTIDTTGSPNVFFTTDCSK